MAQGYRVQQVVEAEAAAQADAFTGHLEVHLRILLAPETAERLPQVVVGDQEIRIEPERPAVSRERFVLPAQLPQRVPGVVPCLGEPRIHLDRAAVVREGL